MKKPSTIKPSTIPVSIRMNTTQIDFLKGLSRALSVKNNKDIRYTDLIREAVETRYPSSLLTLTGEQDG